MRYHEISLAEDAQRDTGSIERARMVVDELRNFFEVKHAGERIETLPHLKVNTTKYTKLYVFYVKDICPEVPFQNLYFAIQFSTIGGMLSGASFNTSHNNDAGYIIVNLAADPTGDTIGGLINWSDVVHEFIHFLDWRRWRGKTKQSWKAATVAAYDGSKADPDYAPYFNSAKEMNAYFQQGVERIFHEMIEKAKQTPDRQAFYKDNWLDTFENFSYAYMDYFNPMWLEALDKNNKMRFKRRLYKLFVFAQATWPNTPAIQKEINRTSELS